LTHLIREATKAWHGVKLDRPDWGENSQTVVLGGTVRETGLNFHLILNAYREPLAFELPPVDGQTPWRRWIDTSLPSPQDIVDWQSAPVVTGSTYRAGPQSVVMLFSQPG
jgi:glycogen operon protein